MDFKTIKVTKLSLKKKKNTPKPFKTKTQLSLEKIQQERITAKVTSHSEKVKSFNSKLVSKVDGFD